MTHAPLLGYIRTSTAEQAYSLAAQKRTIRAAAKRENWRIVSFYKDEGQSGKTLDRRGLCHALEEIAAGHAGGIVVARLDRLSRSVIDFTELLDWLSAAGAVLIALDLDVDTSTPSGRLVANVFASVAAWELATIAQRTRDGLAAARAQGRPVGRPAVPDELAQRIRHMREEDSMTLQAICDRLNADQVPTARGATAWRPSAIQRALGYERRPRRRKIATLPEIPRR
jgi:DNA invertase Pin-like site-specific DNA recombinase